MNQATEYVRVLCYIVSMILIPCEEPTFVYGTNQSVLVKTNSYIDCEEEFNSIAYNFVLPNFAHNKWYIIYINTQNNTSE